ncbi:MAG: secretin N-terminal domain-containing protein [Candidatus Omnitrophota bacterium]
MMVFFKFTKKRRFSFIVGLLLLLIFSSHIGITQEISNPPANSDEGKLSIRVKDTNIKEILDILAIKGKVNIIAGDDVNNLVSVQLKDVYWEQALDIILKTYNYTYKREDNLIRVISLNQAMEEENKVPLVTKIISLNFASVNNLKTSLSKMLSKRGNIEIDLRTNSLIITDISENVDKIINAAEQLDSRTPQVLIEAMMVDVKIQEDDQWGTQMFVAGLKSKMDAAQLNTAMPADEINTFSFRTITDSFDVVGLLDMWLKQNRATILANPKVLTLDNQEAKIEIIEEIPYLETVDSGSGTTTNVKFKDAGIKLSVTPHITQGNFISMNVKPEQSFKSSELGGQPIIDSRRAETNLLVKDGQTIVIGGLRQSKDTTIYEKVPFLGDIPVISIFFKKRSIQKVETELMLFVTPRIIIEPLLKDRELELHEKLSKTKRVVMDERTEPEKIKEFTRSVTDRFKAKKIEEKEVNKKLKKRNRKTRERFVNSKIDDKYKSITRESAPPQAERLDSEEATLRESLDMIKK